MAPHPIPILLLKTRSLPSDGYEEYFANLSIPFPAPTSPPTSQHFVPQFIPVLSHAPNTDSLTRLTQLLHPPSNLPSTYGGIIFTSQRAVEAFASVVSSLDISPSPPSTAPTSTASDTPTTPTPHSPFPLYAVGPATARSLSTLITSSRTLAPLHPVILGAHTGNGAALADYILQHYNALHASRVFTYYEAPRLPFVPLVGPVGEQYGRGKRMEWDEEGLRKRGLLFLVGEVRRDVVPRVLGSAEGVVGGVGRRRGEGGGDADGNGEWKEEGLQKGIEVDEWEVYRTVVREEFGGAFGTVLEGFEGAGAEEGRRGVVVVVVFSPQGCEAMLRGVGLLGERERMVDKEVVRRRWSQEDHETCGKRRTRYVIATIGPTTRDHLRDVFGFEPDVCAEKPTAEGVGEVVVRFLGEMGLLR